jgi:flagellar biosynthesis protein FliR
MTLELANFALLVPVTARILAAIAILPVFGHRSVPVIAKISLAVLLSWLLVLPGKLGGTEPDTFLGYVLGVAGEVMLGLVLGTAANLLFWGLSVAGEIIGIQVGWGFGSTIHMSFENSSAATGQFYSITGTLIFLAIGGHRLLISALVDTFQAAPPYAFGMGAIQVGRALNMMSVLFTSAIQLALPVMGTLILTEASLAFLSRALPSLNAWVFGMPLKVGVALVVLWMGLPWIYRLMSLILAKSPANMQLMLR